MVHQLVRLEIDHVGVRAGADVDEALEVDPFEPTVRIRRHPGSQLGCVDQLDVEPVVVIGRVVVNRDDVDHVRFLPSSALVLTLSPATVVSMLDP